MSAWQSPSLYIGDLSLTVSEEELVRLFEAHGELESVKICRNWNTGQPLGYGFINYRSIEAATKALNELNYCLIKGKPCRLMWSTKRSISAVSEEKAANIYVKGLPRNIDNKALHKLFSTSGTVLSAKVARNKAGVSLGYGYVSFTKLESANKAISELNGKKMGDLVLCVEPFVEKQRRSEKKSSAISVGQIPLNWTENVLELRFQSYGDIKTVVIYRNQFGQSTGFGFIEFFSTQSARLAIDDNQNPTGYRVGGNPIMIQPLSVTYAYLNSTTKEEPKKSTLNVDSPAYYPTRKSSVASFDTKTSASTGNTRDIEEDLFAWDAFGVTNEKTRLSRSSNSDVSGFTLGSDLDALVEDMNNNVFITSFESNNFFDTQMRM